MLAWLSKRFAEKQLGLTGVRTKTYKFGLTRSGRGVVGDKSNHDVIVSALCICADVDKSVRVVDPEKLLSGLRRWERQKGATWDRCTNLVSALLGDDVAL